MKSLRDVRKQMGLTQIEAAKAIKVSRRTYQNYEAIDVNDPEQLNAAYEHILSLLEEYNVDENHGYVTFKQIKNAAKHIFFQHKEVKCAYLFGSYARNQATPKSDVDILVVSDPMGLDFYGMSVELEQFLHKKIDLVSHRQIAGNEDFLERILREGVKIYGPEISQIKGQECN